MAIVKPYLLFTGDADAQFGAKTAEGVLQWRPDDCVGQHRLEAGTVDLAIPFLSLEEGRAAGARTLLVGVTNRGGVLPDHWIPTLTAALEMGYDLASGLHQKLADIPALAAAKGACQLHDVRHWSGDPLPTATGLPRSGQRALMIGTDCYVGKKFTALGVHRAMVARGHKASFRATGQTGLLIAGDGVAIDAVPADFIAGAVEMISPANDPDHWDVIEGQASVLHPTFAGVTLGLVHGAQPDGMILCHEPGRVQVRGLPHRQVPSFAATITAHEAAAAVTNPAAKVVGISLDTHRMDEAAARAAVADAEAQTGLVATDPLRFGADPLVDALLAITP